MFYTAMYDAVFKSVFCKEENRDLLKRLIETSLHEQIEIIDIKPPEMLKQSIYEKNKTLDVLIKCKDKIINLEINSGFYSGLHRRNAGYIFTKYGKDVKAGKNYQTMNEYIQINFTAGLNKDMPILGTYKLSDKNNDLLFIDNLTIYEYNMNRIHELKGKENNFLKMLNANQKDLSKLSKGDELMEKFKEEVENLNEDPLFQDWMTEEKDAIKVRNTLMLEAEQLGLEQGLQQGLQQGLKEKSLEIAKNMLKDNIDINIITKYTGLDLEEIKSLE